MRDKYVKNNNIFKIPKKVRDSNVWKEIINHRNYAKAGLKWYLGDGRKVSFWTNNWVYMLPLVSFVDDDNLLCINLDAKVHEFINHETKEWNISSVSTIIPESVLAYIKAIPCSPIEDTFLWGFSQDRKFTLKSAT